MIVYESYSVQTSSVYCIGKEILKNALFWNLEMIYRSEVGPKICHVISKAFLWTGRTQSDEGTKKTASY